MVNKNNLRKVVAMKTMLVIAILNTQKPLHPVKVPFGSLPILLGNGCLVRLIYLTSNLSTHMFGAVYVGFIHVADDIMWSHWYSPISRLQVPQRGPIPCERRRNSILVLNGLPTSYLVR